MAEYITKEQAYNSVDERIDELRADKEFDIVKGICISGVKKHISAIPTADVVEREKIDKAIKEMESIPLYAAYTRGDIRQMCIDILKRNIGGK